METVIVFRSVLIFYTNQLEHFTYLCFLINFDCSFIGLLYNITYKLVDLGVGLRVQTCLNVIKNIFCNKCK